MTAAITTPDQTILSDNGALKAIRFRHPARAFAFCFQMFKEDKRFAKHPDLAKRLSRQVMAGHYVFIMREAEIVGFASWHHATVDHAAAWAGGKMLMAPDADATSKTAVVVEQWRAASPSVARYLAVEVLKVVGANKVYARTLDKARKVLPIALTRQAA